MRCVLCDRRTDGWLALLVRRVCVMFGVTIPFRFRPAVHVYGAGSQLGGLAHPGCWRAHRDPASLL